jgi:hypothetical protein
MPQISNYERFRFELDFTQPKCVALIFISSKSTKPQAEILLGVCVFKSLTMSYSHMGRPHTTIGAEHFHF